MTDVAQDVWPNDIAVDVVPPAALLRIHAQRLGPLTQGILRSEVRTVNGPGKEYAHQLDVIAPALDNYRRTVLVLRHDSEYYPVRVVSDGFMRVDRPSPLPTSEDTERIAGSQRELISYLREALRSTRMKSVIQTLIARSNERLEVTAKVGANGSSSDAEDGDLSENDES